MSSFLYNKIIAQHTSFVKFPLQHFACSSGNTAKNRKKERPMLGGVPFCMQSVSFGPFSDRRRCKGLLRRGSGDRPLRPRAALSGSLTSGLLPKRHEKTRSAPGLRVFGAGDRDRTGTMFPSADFKSAASANFATPTDFSAFSLPQPAGKCKGGAKKSGGAGQYDTVAGRCAPAGFGYFRPVESTIQFMLCLPIGFSVSRRYELPRGAAPSRPKSACG